MKLRLDEKTLNLYLNKAINEEVNELFGSKNNNINDNLLGTLATDINKFEQLLNIAEQGIGINSQPTQPGNKIQVLGGGFDFVNTTRRNLLTAVEILSGFADRVSNVEQKLGVNALMEMHYSPALGSWVADEVATTAVATRTGTGLAAGSSFAKFLANPYVWIAVAVAITTHCVLVGRSKKKQRDIVRVSNCLQVLANRMKNILEYLAKKAGVQIQAGQQAQGAQQQQIDEHIFNGMNGNKAANYIPNIAKGMAELSSLMKQLESGQPQVEMPQSLSTSAEIKQFQDWANAHGYVDQDGLALVPDGKWGRRTAYVYDQIAATLAQQQTQPQQTGQVQANESKLIKEGQFDRALANLEQKVGVTGTGGAAYADINNMSGVAGGASRLQNSENGYNIAATYPKVLNQYLAKLHGLGFDTGNLQPLPETGKKRFYSSRTLFNDNNLQQIQTRINELLGIVRDAVKGDDTNVVLPPKPVVRKPNPKPQQQQPTQPQTREPIQPILAQTGLPKLDLPTQVTPTQTQPQGLVGIDRQPSLAQSAVQVMGQTANQSNMGLRDRISTNSRTRQNANNAIDQMVRDGSMTRQQARDDKRLMKGAERALRTGQPMNETAFKKLVKQIIREGLMNK